MLVFLKPSDTILHDPSTFSIVSVSQQDILLIEQAEELTNRHVERLTGEKKERKKWVSFDKSIF